MAGYTQPAFFEGSFFSGTAFDLTRSANVTIEVTCTGPWCGGFADVENALIFLRRDGGGTYTFEASPCPGWVFYDPTPADLQTVVTCFANGGC